jgi:hypothetical protein
MSLSPMNGRFLHISMQKTHIFRAQVMVRPYPNHLMRWGDEWHLRPLFYEEGQPWQRRNRAHPRR